MALRGIKPKAVEKRLKMLIYGPPGVGKTTAAIQFPNCYLIDTERGAQNEQYAKLLDAAGGAYFGTADFDDVRGEVASLLAESHDYLTVTIDPLTGIYNDLIDRSAKSLATKDDPEGTSFGRHRAKADRQLGHLLNLLLRLDMNVIITSHAKVLYGDNMKVLGNTFDCYKKLDYLFDLVLEISKRGTDRRATVRKTRIESFVEDETFDFTYDAIADRYGREILEKRAVVESLATPEQVGQIVHLVGILKVPEEITDKWLAKAKAETFAELPKDVAAKCLDYLNDKLKAGAIVAA